MPVLVGYYAYTNGALVSKSSEGSLSGGAATYMNKEEPDEGKKATRAKKGGAGEKPLGALKNSDAKNSDEKNSDEKNSDEKNSKEWLKDYLKKVYGVSMTGPNSLQQDLHESGRSEAVKILSDDFLFRVLARFNDLDVAPCDGLISISEVHNAIINPRLYFDEHDLLMLRLLKHYFHAIQELANAEADASSHHHGISREDIELISASQSERCLSMKKKLTSEFSAKEPAS